MSSVKSVIVKEGGSLYTETPSVSFSGSGGATATAVMKSGSVFQIVVTNGGSYLTAPDVTITPAGGDTTGSGATAIASLVAEPKVYDILDLNTVRRCLKIADGSHGFDDQLQMMISWISIGIERYIRNKVIKQDVTQVFTGDGSNLIKPNYYPIKSISKLQYIVELKETQSENDWIDYAKPYTLVYDEFHDMWIPMGVYMPNDYLRSPLLGSAQIMNCRIIMSCGWDLDEIGDIVDVFIQMVQRRWDQSKLGDNQLGLQAKSKGGSVVDSLTFISMTKEWRDVLDKYKTQTQIHDVRISR